MQARSSEVEAPTFLLRVPSYLLRIASLGIGPHGLELLVSEWIAEKTVPTLRIIGAARKDGTPPTHFSLFLGESVSSSNPTLPIPIVPRRMQHCRHDHRPLSLHNLNDAVRETIRVSPADVPRRMPSAVQQWVVAQRVTNPEDFLDEFRAEPRAAVFIPRRSLGHVPLHFGAELHPPVHCGKRERRRAFISSRGTAEPGFR